MITLTEDTLLGIPETINEKSIPTKAVDETERFCENVEPQNKNNVAKMIRNFFNCI